jgi:sugar (pentulose or hexulose) kinase
MEPQLLAIDLGTQSCRALVFDPKGNLIAKSKISIDTFSTPEPGWVEQDPEQFWQVVCEACQAVWEMPGVRKDAVLGVSITTQRSTVINLGADGKPLRPAIHWSDQRRTPGLKPIGGFWGIAFFFAGVRPTVSYLMAEAEANWIMRNQPEIWEKTHKYMLLSGYMHYRLTGELVESVGNMATYMPFDYKKQNWSGKLDWKWKAVPIEKEKLMPLVPPATLIGHITKEAAEATGIPEGLPLYTAASDKACEVIGAGCVEPNIACLSFGTTATINTTHYKYVEAVPLLPPYPAAIPNAYSLEIQLYRGFWLVSWFKREFGHNEQRLAQKRGVPTEALFDDLINSVPAGSLGLMTQPYWAPGLKLPGPEAKGAIIGFGDIHTRAHVYRSMIEGIGYALREGAERTSRRSRIPIEAIRIAGGGSQSPAAMQIAADIFGLPASRPHVYEASGLGAAIDLAVGLGIHSDFKVAVNEMCRVKDTFEPNPKNQAVYDELYNRIYLEMYSKLKPLYHEISDITGYPPSD